VFNEDGSTSSLMKLFQQLRPYCDFVRRNQAHVFCYSQQCLLKSNQIKLTIL